MNDGGIYPHALDGFVSIEWVPGGALELYLWDDLRIRSFALYSEVLLKTHSYWSGRWLNESLRTISLWSSIYTEKSHILGPESQSEIFGLYPPHHRGPFRAVIVDYLEGHSFPLASKMV